MIKCASTRNGFTIVELLIVVVVIAILASITIISYNGIQKRSLNLQTTTAVSEWAKSLIVYATVNGDYPFTGDVNQLTPYPTDTQSVTDNYPCLGQYPGGRCASVNNVSVLGAGYAFVNPAWNDLMKTQAGSNLPQPNPNAIVINGQPHRGAYINLVGYSTGRAAPGIGPTIAYFLMGNDTQCDPIGAGTMQAIARGDNGVRCTVMLPSFR